MWSTLGFIASLPNGAHGVFDYSDPPDSLPPESCARCMIKRAARVAELGERWVNYFGAGPTALRSRQASGSATVEDLGPPEIAACYFPNRGVSVPEKGRP